MKYQTKNEVLEALRAAQKGSERAEILKNEENRNLILNTGASVTLYCGELSEGNTVREKLSNIFVAVVGRQNSRTGTPDGLGSLGGLCERTNPFEFHNLSKGQKMALVGQKDDVILKDGMPVLTENMETIRKNNVLRETCEELADLGIYGVKLDTSMFELAKLPGIKDDNYIINIWEGKEQSFAVNPSCYILKVERELIDSLQKQSAPQPDSEAREIVMKPIFEMLPHFGKRGGAHQAEDGRNMLYDYRYPHEWLMTWVIAAKTLKHNQIDMIKLAEEAQSQAGHLVSFELAAERMQADDRTIAGSLGISKQAFRQMQKKMIKVHKQKLPIRKKTRDY